MLFAYRGGKRDPTLKAWRKLEAAEREAGIGSDPPASPAPLPEPESIEQRLDRLERLLEEVLARLDRLGDPSAD